MPLKKYHPGVFHTLKGIVENMVSMMGNDANKIDLKENEALIKSTNQKMK